jgi:hypothetical protein
MSKRRSNPSGQFITSMERLKAAYRADLDETQTRAYWDGLNDIDHARLETAIDAAIRSSQWLPKVAELRRFASDAYEPHQPRYIDGKQVFDCNECEDAGVVLVWSHTAVYSLKAGREPQRWQTYVVACVCSAGDRWTRANHPLPRFDAAKMRRPQHMGQSQETGEWLRCFPGLPGDADKHDLREWCSTKPPITDHRNYHPEFAAAEQELF